MLSALVRQVLLCLCLVCLGGMAALGARSCSGCMLPGRVRACAGHGLFPGMLFLVGVPPAPTRCSMCASQQKEGLSVYVALTWCSVYNALNGCACSLLAPSPAASLDPLPSPVFVPVHIYAHTTHSSALAYSSTPV